MSSRQERNCKGTPPLLLLTASSPFTVASVLLFLYILTMFPCFEQQCVEILTNIVGLVSLDSWHIKYSSRSKLLVGVCFTTIQSSMSKQHFQIPNRLFPPSLAMGRPGLQIRKPGPYPAQTIVSPTRTRPDPKKPGPPKQPKLFKSKG